MINTIKNIVSSYYSGKYYPKILGNSIPKSGTHLLDQIFFNMGFKKSRMKMGFTNEKGEFSSEKVEQKIKHVKKGEYLYGHMPFDERFKNALNKNKVSHILIVRDPKDIAASKAFYIAKRPEHRLFEYFNSLSQRDRFIASIKGVEGSMPSIAEFYENYLPWLKEKDCLVVKFEDLVGSRGGGNDQRQLETLGRIARHLGISFNEGGLQEIAFNSFNKNSATFRKGQIGDWVNCLDDEAISILKKDEGVFHEYGYSI
jgi:hypothetical protein